jgi:tripartite-type tricarboxylate transporter receptor subunit TctC
MYYLHTQRNLKLATALMIVALSILMARNTSWSAVENYPTKPIQVIISYAPGDTDANLRPFIDKMPEFLGQPMFFVYKPGGSGAVGASFVAKANPDGYTIIGTSPGPVLMTPFVIEGIDYTLDDFVPICRLAISPNLLVVRTDSPLKTLNDLVLEAKKSPGKLTYGTSRADTCSLQGMLPGGNGTVRRPRGHDLLYDGSYCSSHSIWSTQGTRAPYQ